MSAWRGIAGRFLVGVGVAVVFLLGLEVAARLLPLDRWEGVPAGSSAVFVPGSGADADRYVTNPQFAEVMSIQRFALVKPPGAKRVFILGGSAALGWPGAIEAAFTGYLQRALDRVSPGRYEIINAAAMSYSSHRVLDLLHDIVRYEPDLVVIWSGNNEYVERSVLPRFARNQAMGRVQRVLRHSGLYRALRVMLGRIAPQLFARPEGADITDPRAAFLAQRGMLGRSAETDRQVLANYRANLQEMARVLRDNGVAGAFCTVPVNLADWVPGKLDLWVAAQGGQPSADVEQGRRLAQLREQAATLGGSGDYARAAAVLEELLQAAPQDAVGHYLLGASYLQMGRNREAGAAFSRARDLDPRPIRALSTFEEAISEVAAGEGGALVDLEAAFAAANPAGVPGLDLFLDYVHPNEAGHKLAAVTVLQGALPRLDPGLPLPAITAFIGKDDWARQHKVKLADIDYALGMTLENNGDLEGAEQAYLRSLQTKPTAEAAGNLGVIYDSRGDLAKSREFFQLAVKCDPTTMHMANLALVLYRMKDLTGAHGMVQQFLRQGGVDADSFVKLGNVEAAMGNDRLALEIYQRALAAGGDPRRIETIIGDLYRKLGDDASAQTAYARAAAAR